MPPIRVGCVSYLNSCPLIWGLRAQPRFQVSYHVPAKLLASLHSSQSDVALLPAIDFQRASDLVIVSGTGIAADGHVWTVRLFSRVPIASIRHLYADLESHTSVALCRILLKECFGITPEFRTSRQAENDAELLIGDKVVTSPPADRTYQLDLAEAWKNWTGLPFVFAAWMARAGTDLNGFPAAIEDSLAHGLLSVPQIVKEQAVPRGWPADLAAEYLTRLLHLRVDLSPGTRQRHALELFYAKAAELGVIPSCRPIRLF